MKLQRVLSRVRQAIDNYNMIESGDCICVGISGGKDSLTLVCALAKLSEFYPLPFTVKAITIDLGFNNVNFDKIKRFCEELNIEYRIIETQISQIVFDERKESNPCSLCANMRKGTLNQAAKEMGCNKIAYAHHKDDVIETMMLSLLYEGRFHTFCPVTHLEKSKVTLIRPLIYMNESDIIGFVNKYEIPVLKSPCPVDGYTKREYVHELIRDINKTNPGVKERMFTAICDSTLEGWNVDEFIEGVAYNI